jgi:hypothetical protein
MSSEVNEMRKDLGLVFLLTMAATSAVDACELIAGFKRTDIEVPARIPESDIPVPDVTIDALVRGCGPQKSLNAARIHAFWRQD